MLNGAAVVSAPAGVDPTISADGGYRMHLPLLPHGERLETTVFLHGDLRGRPYRTQDFAEALEDSVGMKHVVGLCVFQFNHVLICTLDSAEAKERLIALKELTVKGKRCVIIDPNQREATIRVHWLPAFVTDGEVEDDLACFGTLKCSTREKWRAPNGAFEVETTTRSMTLVLKVGVNKENLPHQTSIARYPVLLSVPGRPPLCLRCNELGHMRRQCRALWCRKCRGFGNAEIGCVPTYAGKARGQVHTAHEDVFLDDGDNKAEASASAEPWPPFKIVAGSENLAGPGELTEVNLEVGKDGEGVTPVDNLVELTNDPATLVEPTISTQAAKAPAPLAPSAKTAAPCKPPQQVPPHAVFDFEEPAKATRHSLRHKPK